MRNASETPKGDNPEYEPTVRATFEAPRSLVDEFRALATRRERTLSAELRKLMADALEAHQDER
jgi:hypothetical protein